MAPPPTTISTTGTANVGGLVSSGWVNATNTKFTNDLFWGATNRTDTIAYPEQTASYIIWKDGSTYYAKNGHTGQIDYSGSDASTVIQTTINALTSGGEIFIKSGEYQAQLNLVDKQNIIIRGEGGDYEQSRGTIIKAPDNLNDHLVKIDGTNMYGFRVDIIIKDLTLVGNSAHQTSGNLIDINHAYGVKIINCQFRDAKDYAIRGGATNSAEQITIDSCFIGSGGIYLASGSGWYIHDNEIAVGSTKNGITVYSSSSQVNTIEGNTIYLCKKGIFVYNEVKYLSILDNKIWENSQSGIDIDAGCSKIIVSKNHILSNDKGNTGWAGLNIRNDVGVGCINITVEDNVFDDYQGVPTQTYHIKLENDADYISIKDNIFGTYQTGVMSLVGTHNIVNFNLGFVTENSGTFSIALHSKTATVTHGLSYTPTASDIGITWTTVGGLLNCTSWSVTGITSTQFTVNLYDANGAAKGPSGTVTGSWKSIKTP
jgi:parallel beta-helix repeat protein